MKKGDRVVLGKWTGTVLRVIDDSPQGLWDGVNVLWDDGDYRRHTECALRLLSPLEQLAECAE